MKVKVIKKNDDVVIINNAAEIGCYNNNLSVMDSKGQESYFKLVDLAAWFVQD